MEKETFVASGDSLKTLTHAITVKGNREAVFSAWTTSKGIQDFLEVEADIDLRPGGRFELYFAPKDAVPPGKRGSEGCVILSYLPSQMLSFSWNAPPHFPKERALRTWVVVRFREAGEGLVRVTLDHTGFGNDGQWDEVYTYFDNAWQNVLKALGAHFGTPQVS